MAAVETRRSGSDAVTTTTHELYQRYWRQIYAYCLHKLRSREEAEDAVQTTFKNAFRSLQRGATTEYEQAWLYKIAHNVCLERSTSSARRLRLETPNDIDLVEDLLPSRRTESALELIGIEDALESMPENQRRAILLREWKGLSYREIGEELGLSQAAVEMLIFRARRSLAGALEQPEEPGRRRAARSALIAGLLGAVKALFGGGAAIKAIGAAAAVVVVGESAQHTIVQQRSSLKPVVPVVKRADARRAAPAFARAPVVSTHRTVQRLVPASTEAARVVPHVAVKPVQAHTTVVAATPKPAPAPVPVAAPAPAPVAAPAPQPPVERQPAAVPPPAPTPPPAPVVEEPEPVVAETPVAPPDPPAQTAPPAPPAPAVDRNPDSPGNGHAYGRDKPDTPGKPDKP
jgi:RNA polymerase sigma factor (sigma-70 family)